MSRRFIIILIIILEVLILGGLVWWSIYAPRDIPVMADTAVPDTAAEESAGANETTSAVTEETAVPETTLPETTAEPQPTVYTLSFAGDCTLGNFKDDYGSQYSFMGVVGDDYDYPFAKVQQWFAADDFTLVNFEGTLTNYTVATEKTYNFHAPPEYAAILTAGSVEGVNISNNHT